MCSSKLLKEIPLRPIGIMSIERVDMQSVLFKQVQLHAQTLPSTTILLLVSLKQDFGLWLTIVMRKILGSTEMLLTQCLEQTKEVTELFSLTINLDQYKLKNATVPHISVLTNALNLEPPVTLEIPFLSSIII